MVFSKALNYIKKIHKKKKEDCFKNFEIDQFKAKRKDIVFRNEKWFDFKGNLYRNAVEIPSALKNFQAISSDLVLEVGAGSGRFTREFTKTGAEVIALDYSLASMKMNKARSNCQGILADLCYLPFRSAVFDKVAAISVLQCVPTQGTRLRGLLEIKRVSRSKAKFLIEIYNYRLFFDRLKRNSKEGCHRTSPPVYFYRFDVNEFKLLIQSLFPEILDFRCILFFQLFMSGKLGNIVYCVKFIALLEAFLEKTLFSRVLGDRILAVCQN